MIISPFVHEQSIKSIGSVHSIQYCKHYATLRERCEHISSIYMIFDAYVSSLCIQIDIKIEIEQSLGKSR